VYEITTTQENTKKRFKLTHVSKGGTNHLSLALEVPNTLKDYIPINFVN